MSHTDDGTAVQTALRTGLSRRSVLLGAASLAAGGTLATLLPSGVAQAAGMQLQYYFYAQETSYSCSAASARIALSARGVYKSEATLRADLRLGTEPNLGLDDITYLVNTMNKYTAGYYRLRQWPLASYTLAQFGAKLTADVVNNVNHGYAVVMNVDVYNSGPNNPQPSGGHYLAIVGYSDTSYRIADPFTSRNSPGFWTPKSTVWGWNKLRRYVAAVNLPVGTGPRPPFPV